MADRICAELKKGLPTAQVAAEVQRFSSGEGTISVEQANRAVMAARNNVCPAS